jgi:hypothetical protein
MAALVPPNRVKEFGFPRNYSNRHAQRLEADGILPRRVPISRNQYAYVADELMERGKAYVEALIARRDAKPKAKPLFPRNAEAAA